MYCAPATLAYPLSLHHALPISLHPRHRDLSRLDAVPEASLQPADSGDGADAGGVGQAGSSSEPSSWIAQDRKSTRLNSSHLVISYAVFCLKKKKEYQVEHTDDD